MLHKNHLPDGKPTMYEWPVRIWDMGEIPPQFVEAVRLWMQEPFEAYHFVYAPRRRTNPESYAYLFGYGSDTVLFLRGGTEADGGSGGILRKTEISRQQITDVFTGRELLNAEIVIHYREMGAHRQLAFPYVPSVYYLYDPFLNWLLGIDREFLPALAERDNPRPDKLYRESLAMYNYSLGAYRLGNGFQEYQYRLKQHRCKWMPWKKTLEEWLEIAMERGQFWLHSYGYLTECNYHIQ